MSAAKKTHRAAPRAPRTATPKLKPAPRPAGAPAAWLTNIKDPTQRRSQLRYLQQTIKELRRVYSGFAAADGYDARYLKEWSAARRAQVQKWGARLHAQISDPDFILVRPRSRTQKAALRLHTGQGLARQKAFVVHVPKPETTQVRYVYEPPVPMGFGVVRPARMRVETVRRVNGGEALDRDYLFLEVLGYQPFTWDEIVASARELIPLMPDRVDGEPAWYTILSATQGPISSPARKAELLRKLTEWGETYDKGMAEVLIGFRYQGTRWEAAMAPDSEYNKRLNRRARFAQIKREDRNARRRLKWDGELALQFKPSKKKKRRKARAVPPRRVIKHKRAKVPPRVVKKKRAKPAKVPLRRAVKKAPAKRAKKKARRHQ